MPAPSPLALTQQQYFALMVQAYQAACIAAGIPVADTGVGSTLGAFFQSSAQAAMNLQSQVDIDFAASRLQTSTGADVDTFVAPFGFSRKPGSYATAALTFTFANAGGAPVLLPVGVIVQRSDGKQYIVVADGTQPTYSTTLQGYLLSSGAALTATAQCLTIGSAGNTPAGTIIGLYGGLGNPLPLSIVSVTNASLVGNGVDGETDSALIARFQLTNGLAKYGTRVAILSAVAGTQPGLTYQFGDHQNPDGSYHAAYFCVIVNVAGSATAPPASLLSAIATNVDGQFPGGKSSAGIEFGIFGPSLLTATVSAIIPGASPTLLATMSATTASYVNGIGLNAAGSSSTLSYAGTAAMLVAAAGGLNVTNLRINGSTADVVAPFATEIIAGTPLITSS